MTNTSTEQKMVATIRFMCNSSTAHDTRISSREMVDVRAAMVSSTKNSVANTVPKGRALKTFGSTT